MQRDWDRATTFYIQAWQNGMKEAADRLAAGYAAPENGADVAAALWWAARGQGLKKRAGMPDCRVDPAAADDIDRFMAELQTWPQSRLAICDYVTGVMSTMVAEIKYPTLALSYGVEGEVDLRFQPAVPRIDMRKGGSREYRTPGIADGNVLRDRTTTRVSDGFEKAMSVVAERALRRYPQPAGIPAEASIGVLWVFEIKQTR